MIHIRANHVAVTREDWGDLVVLSADEDLATEQYLMLQAKDRYDDQDVRLGMDDIYVETCGQGWSWYGNIELFALTRNCVFVQLSREAASRMGNDGSKQLSRWMKWRMRVFGKSCKRFSTERIIFAMELSSRCAGRASRCFAARYDL